MEISIGIRHVARELTVDVDLTREEIAAKVEQALANGTVLTFTAKDGNLVVVPSDALGYVQCKDSEIRRVGFGF
ncbi:DUF3107 domain-containing protein [Trueperella pyogenes]|uniref:DUF3107 domain-containing protein n=1 Tax=Trueperella pyogenes TaxID=1661 RepID=X4RBW2_9ACTO|nr:DUF3107 domain-containing protein [Trueperella pyogenes]AHU89275.1 ATP-binding protein [Trueperella pyogenes]AJC69336.1 ATP-binding protein [Trueperella pyogenes TP8]ALD73992.1 hypothetical protein AN946_06320 [Trueperella pyogenes]AWA44485.1 DUF3107 domain-containing protein [Trueperella pyogenes]AWG04372.1 DUF3107 domain-containing protein [Trueperella pyogenes]